MPRRVRPSKNADLRKLRLDKCPVCGKKGSGPHWRAVYNRVHKRYVYPYFAHYAGYQGNTRKIDWCYISKKRLVAAFEEDRSPKHSG